MHNIRTFARFLCPTLALFATAEKAFAQADSVQLSGFVRDASGAVIPGASVTASNESTGVERSVQTNENGYFVITPLQPGLYSIVAEAEGFKITAVSGNKLDATISAQVDVQLEIGSITESIEVTANAAQLQTESTTVGRLVEEQQIEKIVLNGRNPIFLAQLKPGVLRNGSLAGFNFGLTSGGFSINGSRSQDNMISFDGAVNMRTRANGTSIGVPDVEAVQEMQIMTANYPAEFGGSNGGQIRIVSRSGGRDFHGRFYEYFRNSELDANTWSRNRAGQDREKNNFNQFGYNLSGPVYIPGKWNTDRNKLFWMWGQEWVRRRRDVTSIQTVATQAMRNGDFSELLDPGNTFFNRAVEIKDPDTGPPFANNIIPQNRLSSNGIGFLNSHPLPTPGFIQGTNNFIQTRPQPTDQLKSTFSADWNPTQEHAVRFRLQAYNQLEPEAFRGGTDRAVRTIERPNASYTLNHIWTISPTLINDLNINVSYDRVFLEVPITDRLDRRTYGIDYPYIFPDNKEFGFRIPTVNISNFVTIDGGPYPASSAGPIYQLSDSVSKIWGNHTVKIGGRFERSGQNDFDQINVSGVPGGTNNQNGRFVFTDDRAGAPSTGRAISNAAMGLFTTYAELGPRAFTPYRRVVGEAFLQDSWKATSKLRVEMGVRYSIMTPYYYSTWRNMSVFDARRYDPNNDAIVDRETGNVLGGNRLNGVVIPGTGFTDAALGRVPAASDPAVQDLFTGDTKYFGQVQKLNFQPRVGVAYRLGDKSVLRAGGGRYYSRPGVADNIFLGGNPPFQPSASIQQGDADNPGGGASVGFPQFFMTNDPVYKIPSSWMWNLTFQREVGFNTLIEVGCVGRVGLHLERVRNSNQLPVGTTLLPENQGANVNALRPYKGFGQIVQGENAARSEYDGLQISAERRFSEGLSFGVAYTYSQNRDNADGRRDQIYNNYDDRNFWGWSDSDFRQVLVTNFVDELPFLKYKSNMLGKIAGGWTLSGVVQFQTGSPTTITTGDDFAGTGDGGQPWEVSQDPKLSRSDRESFADTGSADAFFFATRDSAGNPIFTEPQLGTFSRTQNRNEWVRNPGFQNWNLGVFKDFSITEQQRITFRMEMFNLPNHPKRSGLQANPRGGAFGRVTSKDGNRNNQLSLKYAF